MTKKQALPAIDAPNQFRGEFTNGTTFILEEPKLKHFTLFEDTLNQLFPGTPAEKLGNIRQMLVWFSVLCANRIDESGTELGEISYHELENLHGNNMKAVQESVGFFCDALGL